MINRLFILLLAVIFYSANAKSMTYDTVLRDSILSNISGASISKNKVSILRYGAKGDGVHDCRKAFEKAMKDALKKGGLHIMVPSGVYYM